MATDRKAARAGNKLIVNGDELVALLRSQKDPVTRAEVYDRVKPHLRFEPPADILDQVQAWHDEIAAAAADPEPEENPA